MQTSKVKTLLTLGSTLLLLSACSTREVQDSTPEEETEQVEEEETAVETEEQEEEETVQLGKRTNPIPIGESIVYTETYYDDDYETEYKARFETKIIDVVRGEEAFTILKTENEFNEPAPEGMEWAILTLEGTLHEGDEDVPYTVVPFFSVIDSNGSQVPQDAYATLDGDEYGYVDLFPGGQTNGRVAVYMPVDDASLFVLDDLFGGDIYFSLTE